MKDVGGYLRVLMGEIRFRAERRRQQIIGAWLRRVHRFFYRCEPVGKEIKCTNRWTGHVYFREATYAETNIQLTPAQKQRFDDLVAAGQLKTAQKLLLDYLEKSNDLDGS